MAFSKSMKKAMEDDDDMFDDTALEEL